MIGEFLDAMAYYPALCAFQWIFITAWFGNWKGLGGYIVDLVEFGLGLLFRIDAIEKGGE